MLCRSKYKNKKVSYNGETYDSVKEYRRHDELKLLQRAGKISGLERQVKFELIPSQRDPVTNKVLLRGVSYVADFVYEKDGQRIVEDVKGYRGGGAYAIFQLKKKMMLYLRGILIQEV